MQVVVFLEKQGFTRVHNLVGGIDAWSRTVDAAVPLY
jgi:rhodanese-related sulfurtransferase